MCAKTLILSTMWRVEQIDPMVPLYWSLVEVCSVSQCEYFLWTQDSIEYRWRTMQVRDQPLLQNSGQKSPDFQNRTINCPKNYLLTCLGPSTAVVRLLRYSIWFLLTAPQKVMRLITLCSDSFIRHFPKLITQWNLVLVEVCLTQWDVMVVYILPVGIA